MELSIEGCSIIAILTYISGKFVLCRQNTLLERMAFHIDRFLLKVPTLWMSLAVHPLNVKSSKRGINGKYVRQSQNIPFIHKVKKWN